MSTTTFFGFILINLIIGISIGFQFGLRKKGESNELFAKNIVTASSACVACAATIAIPMAVANFQERAHSQSIEIAYFVLAADIISSDFASPSVKTWANEYLSRLAGEHVLITTGEVALLRTYWEKYIEYYNNDSMISKTAGPAMPFPLDRFSYPFESEESILNKR